MLTLLNSYPKREEVSIYFKYSFIEYVAVKKMGSEGRVRLKCNYICELSLKKCCEKISKDKFLNN